MQPPLALPLKVVIIGCGNIAGGFDQHWQPGELPYTHAAAFYEDSRFVLQACIEPDAPRRQAFAQRWQIPHAFDSIEAWQQADIGAVDIVSLCCSTPAHYDALMALLPLRPRLVFCEKPVTTTLEHTQQIIQAYRQAGILMAVNYNRRWDPQVQQLRQQLTTGELGALRSVVGYYNKGVLNNGSHLIDLIQYLLGELTLVATGPKVIDYSTDDPSCCALLLTCAQQPVHLVTAHAQDYALFELQLITVSGLITLINGGQQWRVRHPRPSQRFAGYIELGEDQYQPGGYGLTFRHAVDNLYQALVHQAPLVSDGASACQAQQLCEQIAQAQQ